MMLRNRAYLAMLLCALPAFGESATVQVPTRSLLPMMAKTDQAKVAYVHTEFATGPAFFFTATGEVLTTLHTVLTPTRQLPAKVSVGFAASALGNIVQVQSVPVAEDAADDLVLLRVAGPVPSAAGTSPAASPGVAADDVAVPVAPAHKTTAPRRRSRTAHSRRSRATYHHSRSSSSSATHHHHHVPVHVVWDGPKAP